MKSMPIRFESTHAVSNSMSFDTMSPVKLFRPESLPETPEKEVAHVDGLKSSLKEALIRHSELVK